MTKTSFAKYLQAVRDSPRDILNRRLFLTVCTFALCGFPKGWDEGSAASITQLKSFQKEYGLHAKTDAATISNIVSFVNLGAGVGALLSYFLNDRLGRIQSMRVYQFTYAIGSLISCFSYGNHAALYIGRIVAGLGIGACTVVGPLTIAEIAPKTIRGLMTLWFNVCMLSGQMIGVFVVFGCTIHIPNSELLQYQVPWFVQAFIPLIAIVLSFFIVESPRWLAVRNRPQDALQALLRLRGLPEDHPYVQDEYSEIVSQIGNENMQFGNTSFMHVLRETFCVRSNLRRVQLTIVAYILAQFSGANVITNYLPTIFGLIGVQGINVKIYATGLYSMTKFICGIAASLFFVDMLGRRKSLLAGATIQLVCQSYLAGYLNRYTSIPKSVSKGASDAAIAIVYIHAFGWVIGLYTLPYLFGAELWPNRIRSFGGALSQCFHWLFYFAILKATPSMLSSMHTWGTFLFFAVWCLIAIVYAFFCVPETAGLSLEQMDYVFQRPIYKMRHTAIDKSENIEYQSEQSEIKDKAMHIEHRTAGQD